MLGRGGAQGFGPRGLSRGRRRAPRRARRQTHWPHGRHRRDHSGGAGCGHSGALAGRARRPGRPRNRARRQWPCTAPPTCSTTTGICSRDAACCLSARPRRSCATSTTCFPRWERPGAVSTTLAGLVKGVRTTVRESRRHRGSQGQARHVDSDQVGRARAPTRSQARSGLPHRRPRGDDQALRRARGTGPGAARREASQRGPRRVRQGDDQPAHTPSGRPTRARDRGRRQERDRAGPARRPLAARRDQPVLAAADSPAVGQRPVLEAALACRLRVPI